MLTYLCVSCDPFYFLLLYLSYIIMAVTSRLYDKEQIYFHI